MMASRAAERAMQIADEAEAHFAQVEKTGKPALFVPSTGGPVVRASNAIIELNNVEFRYQSIEQAFPAVDPGCDPLGSTVLVQIRQPLAITAGGLEIDANARKTELDNTQVAKVIAIGPLAFKNRDKGQDWPEGAWCAPGDFVRIPKYQGDRWAISYRRDDGGHDLSVFVLLKDLALLGKYPTVAAALSARAFL